VERHHGYRGSTKKALNEVGKVDAVYIQGAVLDPIKVLDKIERELKTTVVASNPLMLWFMLAELDPTYHIAVFGSCWRSGRR